MRDRQSRNSLQRQNRCRQQLPDYGYSHIAHDCLLKDNIIIGNASQIAGEVEIDDFAIVSGGSLVHQFSRISKHVMIQGGSRIGKDIPPYT